MLATACVEDAAPPPLRGDQLVLELGGNGPSLRAALQRSSAAREASMPTPGRAEVHAAESGGGTPDGGQHAAAEQPPQPPAAQTPDTAQAAEKEPEQPAKTPVKPAEKPAEKSPQKPAGAKPAGNQSADKPAADKANDKGGKTVKLRRGQNLYRVALEQLGDGGRWREIAKLNGWSERDIANLAADTPIRLPAR